MDTDEPNDFYGKLTHQQQRFCDEYLIHFNAFKAAVNSGYSENTSRKGALLHVPKIQRYLKERMAARSQRLEITHDMILRELSKIAFSNMGNYYDEYACLKRMNELTVDEKAAIAYYDITEVQDGEGYRVGMQSRIKLHNKMSALDKIARHLNFYGTVSGKSGSGSGSGSSEWQGKEVESPEERSGSSEWQGKEVESPESGALSRESFNGGKSESAKFGAEDPSLTLPGKETLASVLVDKSIDNLPMDYPEEDFELEGIDLKTLVALEGVSYSPGARWEESLVAEVSGSSTGSSSCKNEMAKMETIENMLTISPLGRKSHEPGVQSLESGMSDSELRASDSRLKKALDSVLISKQIFILFICNSKRLKASF